MKRLGAPDAKSPGRVKSKVAEAHPCREERVKDGAPLFVATGASQRHAGATRRGIPLSLVPSGANVHDSKLLEQTPEGHRLLSSQTQKRPTETLCVDAGYVGYPVLVTSRKQNYQLNLKTRAREREEKLGNPEHEARRWVVERTHSWLNRFRKLLVSFEKTKASYLALLFLAAALICWRQTIPICSSKNPRSLRTEFFRNL